MMDGNESTTMVHRRDYVDLRFTSGNIVSLFNVLHVLNRRKIESNKFVYPNMDARLGHVYLKRVQYTSKDGLILVFDMDTENDLCDLHATPSLWNKKHFVTFIDDASRLCYVYFKVFNIDGTTFIGIIYETTAPCTSQQNGISERKTRDAIFNENKFPSVPKPSQRSFINGTEYIGGLVVLGEVVTQQPEPELIKKAINDERIPSWVTTLGCWLIYLQGFRQKSRIDYFDTYAPVARISTIRLMIALASIHGLIIYQMDMKTTFLNGELEEKHAPKKLHQKFDEVVLSNGYLLNQAHKYVIANLIKLVDLTKEFLSSRFFMKDMGEADVILGIWIKHESNEISISQSHYIEKVLKKFNYFDCTPMSTPVDTSEKLMPNNGQDVSQIEYSRVIGCLIYVMTFTMPDIAFAVGKLSRYTSNPGT
ncbi:zinc finger, CCHC-type containing protein [Tanacetum coccineum]